LADKDKDKGKGKGKVAPVLNKVPRHKDIPCGCYAMMTYLWVEV